MLLLQGDVRFEKEFSLDLSDEEAAEYVAHILHGNPRLLHEAVAADPLAATKCFHWTVKLVLRTLFNCADAPGLSADIIDAQECFGIFGMS